MRLVAKLGLTVAVGGLIAIAAVARDKPSNSADAVTTTAGAPVPATPGHNTSTVLDAGAIDRNAGAAAAAAAAADADAAAATTSANAPQPAKGAKSFAVGEARRHIKGQGFSTVADHKKDNDSIRSAQSMKNGPVLEFGSTTRAT